MFDIGWFELFIVVVVAVVVVGPKDLPKMMRAIGRWTGRARAMADQFRRSFDDMARQAELEEMRAEMMRTVDDKSLAKIKRETDEMLGQLPSDPTKPLTEAPKPRPAAARAVGEDDDAPKIAAPKEEASASPTERPAAPEPQSPLHRDEP